MIHLFFFIIALYFISAIISIFCFYAIINKSNFFSERNRISKIAREFGIKRKFLETNESLKIRMRNAIYGKYPYPSPNETINCRCVTVCVEGLAPIKKLKMVLCAGCRERFVVHEKPYPEDEMLCDNCVKEINKEMHDEE
jgi:formylmethanofuran dehydrogenase subunit E